MLLVRGLPDGRTAVMVKVHNALGGSQAIIAALTQLFGTPPLSPAPNRAAGRAHPRPRRRAQEAARTVSGLWHLARAGRAPATSLCGRSSSEHRRYIPLALLARDVAITARRVDAGIAELLLAVTAEAIGRLLRSRGELTACRVVRAAVPRAQSPPSGGNRARPSNQSAVDLPIAQLSPAERLRAVSGQFRTHLRRGEPAAAAFVLRAMKALADGVGLAIGAMTWGKSLSVGILADAALVPDADQLADEFTKAFGNFQDAVPGERPAQRSGGR